MMLDIDHFKNVNDQYGHKAGDEVLSTVAASIKQCLRPGDVAGRYGGEEFVVLVSGASLKQCLKIAERIRQSVAQQTFHIGQAVTGVTISLGVAWMNPDRMFPLEGLSALFPSVGLNASAKRQGRNRVVAWTENEKSMEMGEMDKPS